MFVQLLALSLSLCGQLASATPGRPTPSLSTSLTLLYQNNLNSTDDANHVGFLVLDKFSQKDAAAACGSVNEKLLSKATIKAHDADILKSLSYHSYAGRASGIQLYHIDSGVLAVTEGFVEVTFPSFVGKLFHLPVLCTQSSNSNWPTNSAATPTNKVSVSSGGNTFVGYRNQKSFRFLGVPYADPPKRFEYSVPYSTKGETIDTTKYGSQCAQGGSGSDDCLFINIQTPYIPKPGSKKDLRPVMFWIHGGGFTGGSGADQGTDGGNMASREDIVTININYRLSTLGFLAIPGTNITGNYGIGDQITALDWTIANIAAFGGDPKKITINGESAGAGSVRALLGSPKAIGKFQGAIAMSNLGGGVNLGLSGTYATSYSSYLTIEESYAAAGQNIFSAAGCTQSSLDAQIACLKALPALTVVGLSAVARYVVQDNYIVNTPQLIVTRRTPNTAHVPVIFGITANDGASFSNYPKTPVTSLRAGLEVGLGISAENAQTIIDSKLFPYYDTGDVTYDSFNVTQRVSTDSQFRCIDQATVYAGAKSGAFKSSYYYEIQRGFGGYDPNNVGGPPVTPGFPNGNPNLPYYRLHGSEISWMFGTLGILRDAGDLLSSQLTTAYFAEFVKRGEPNPDAKYLRIRGYESTQTAVKKTGPWGNVKGVQGPIKKLDYPSVSTPFVDVEQCAFLKYPLSYYLDGGV